MKKILIITRNPIVNTRQMENSSGISRDGKFQFVINDWDCKPDFLVVNGKADRKIKKKKGQEMILTLVENPDVAKAVGEMKKPGQTLVGFAAETDHTQENALEKLAKKNLDLIVANDVTREGAGFNTDTNIASLISHAGIRDYPLMSKKDLAGIILDSILEIRNGTQS